MSLDEPPIRLELGDQGNDGGNRVMASNQTLLALAQNGTDGTTNLSADSAKCTSNSEQTFLIALTLPLWTFATLYLLILLIHHLRRKQYFHIYDKCSWRNAHFRYDFHIVIGKHTSTYNRHESYVILDLLDSQQVSMVTVQMPGSTLFNDNQVFVYHHSRDDLRCINFTVYRRHPIKEVRSIRIAHTCNNADSRLYIYGVEIHDNTNNENYFYPVLSVIKYRGTQWALSTTFESRLDVNFKRLGVECYDPFGYSFWPTYFELLTILLYIWCANYCFGSLMSVQELGNSIVVHAVTIFFITASSAAALCFVYLYFIKTRILDNHFATGWWLLAQAIFVLFVIGASLGLWTLTYIRASGCVDWARDWVTSTGSCSLALTLVILLTWLVADCRRKGADSKARVETDAQLTKTNSRENVQYIQDPKPGLCSSLCARQKTRASHSSAREGPPKNWNALGPQTDSKKRNKSSPNKPGRSTDKGARASKQQQQQQEQQATNKDDDTLDTAFGVGSKYIKAKNRNSISQYV